MELRHHLDQEHLLVLLPRLWGSCTQAEEVAKVTSFHSIAWARLFKQLSKFWHL